MSSEKLLNDLAEINQVNISDIKIFLSQGRMAFSILSVSTKYIENANHISVSLIKNSANSLYLEQPKSTKLLFPNQPPLKSAQTAHVFNSSVFDLTKLGTGQYKKNNPFFLSAFRLSQFRPFRIHLIILLVAD